MREPDEEARRRRVDRDNPWRVRGEIDPEPAAWPRRSVHVALRRRMEKSGLIHLRGPRRVGKTTLVRQAVNDAFAAGFPPASIHWIDFAAPILTRAPPDELAALPSASERSLLVFDSVHRRPDWEREMGELSRRYPAATIIAISVPRPAVPSLLVPHLSFREHLAWTGAERELIEPMVFGRGGSGRTVMYTVRDVVELNRRFHAHATGGGFPEAVMSRLPGRDAARTLSGELMETTLHSDLPALDGVGDGEDLTRLFSLIAWNTGAETSIEALAERTGSAKNTVRRHLEHLISVGLIVRLPRVRAEGGRFQRMRTFKLHLTTPSLFAALFGPPDAARPLPTALAECAAVAEWLGTPDADRLHFARLPEGDVDLVALDPETDRPNWVCRVSTDDASVETPPGGLIRFAELNAPLRRVEATTNTLTALRVHGGIEVWHRPLAQYCYEVGRRAGD